MIRSTPLAGQNMVQAHEIVHDQAKNLTERLDAV